MQCNVSDILFLQQLSQTCRPQSVTKTNKTSLSWFSSYLWKRQRVFLDVELLLRDEPEPNRTQETVSIWTKETNTKCKRTCGTGAVVSAMPPPSGCQTEQRRLIFIDSVFIKNISMKNCSQST